MTCPRCGSWCAPSDNYCRNCGDKLQMVLPPAPPLRTLAALPAALPPAVVKGVALALAGKAAEWALRRAVRKLAGSLGQTAWQALRRQSSAHVVPTQPAPPVLPAAGVLITEVLVMWQRVRRMDETDALPPPRR